MKADRLTTTVRRFAAWNWGLAALILLVHLTLLQKQSWVIPRIGFGSTPSRALMVMCASLWFLSWLSYSDSVLRGRTGVRIGALVVPLAGLLALSWAARKPGAEAFVQDATTALL
ncbi:MAG TPA: hypothetical protein PL091_16480 [Actinomycetota bacterium]|nr:hypothetical protein [Actinomycetota bacterium]HRY11456.1 hypothetical protein [Candidatus Nanopelagicales bacterium]